MALIPPDAGVRMRMQTEASLVQPLAPAHEIPSDLPELKPGQNFTARIQEVLPNNSYQALVAGKQLTLQLPEGAKPGDQLDLVVIDRSPKVVIARQVEGGNAAAAGNAGPYPFAQLSSAARLISQLLPAEGETAAPAQLNRGQPLLAQPPQGAGAAAQLAPALARAITQSGLFYEAHQAQWVGGQRPLAQLLEEPQGQRSAPAAFRLAAAESAAAGIPPATPAPAGEAKGMGQVTQAAASASLVAQVPDELRPLVQQQLEAAAAQRMVWHGEVWPRQTLELEIQRDREREADGRVATDEDWSTTLSLTTPRLGRIDARLRLGGGGVRIALAASDEASAAGLRNAAPQLAAALEAAGLPLLNFQVQHAPTGEQP